jgi:hypothetical protein
LNLTKFFHVFIISLFAPSMLEAGAPEIFGSWCWAPKPAEFLTGHSKFDLQAILCRMIGYEQNGHWYRLLDISSNSIFVGRHVIFDKTVEMQDKQGYVAICTTFSTSSFCLVVWSARETATGPPLPSPFVENVNNTSQTT